MQLTIWTVLPVLTIWTVLPVWTSSGYTAASKDTEVQVPVSQEGQKSWGAGEGRGRRSRRGRRNRSGSRDRRGRRGSRCRSGSREWEGESRVMGAVEPVEPVFAGMTQ